MCIVIGSDDYCFGCVTNYLKFRSSSASYRFPNRMICFAWTSSAHLSSVKVFVFPFLHLLEGEGEALVWVFFVIQIKIWTSKNLIIYKFYDACSEIMPCTKLIEFFKKFQILIPHSSQISLILEYYLFGSKSNTTLRSLFSVHL